MIARTLQANFAIQVITFASSIMMARILGPTGRGELALVLLYPQLIANIAFMGVDRAVAVLGGRGELSRPVLTITKLVLLFSIPAIIIGYVTVNWRVTNPHLSKLSIIYLIYVPAMQFFLLVVSLFNGVGDFLRFNLTRLAFYVFNLILIMGISLSSIKILPVLDLVLLGNLAAVYGVMFFSVWMLRSFIGSVKKEAIKKTTVSETHSVLRLAVVFALPMTLAQFSNSAYQITLEHFMGVKALGLFVILLTYSRLLSPVGSAIGSHVFHVGISGGNRDIARIFRLSMVIYSFGIVPLWILAGWLIPIIFGRDFVVDSGTVGVLLVSTLFGQLADNMSEYMNGQQKVKIDIISRILYLSTFAMLGYWMLSRYGLPGMAMLMVIAELMRCVYFVKSLILETKKPISEFVLVTWYDIGFLYHKGIESLLKIIK